MNKLIEGQYEMICLEDMVAKDHILRKIDEAIDFTHIYDIVKEKYCPDNGRPSIDLVVLFKIVLIQHLFGIPSQPIILPSHCKVAFAA